jgi:hypothetical protein
MTQAQVHDLACEIGRAVESYVQAEAREIAREEAYRAAQDALAGQVGGTQHNTTTSPLSRLERAIERALQPLVTSP